MSQIMQIPVTAYVFKYVHRTYGPASGPFHLGSSKQNTLRLALSNVEITASLMPPPERLPGYYLYLDLGSSKDLHEQVQQVSPFLKSGYFFMHEFNLALLTFIEAQRALAKRLRLKETQWSARVGLENFLEHYQIEEYEYSYESLRRQYNRINREKKEYFEAKLYAKFDFCTHPQGGQYQPCRLWHGARPRICFHAFSRSAGKVVRVQLAIPQTWGDSEARMEWIDIHFRLINSFLKRGYTIA